MRLTCVNHGKNRGYLRETGDGTPLAAVWSDDHKLSSGFTPFPKVKMAYPEAKFIDLMGAERKSAVPGEFQLTPFPYFIRGKRGDHARFMDALKEARIAGVQQLPCLISGVLSNADSVSFTFRNDRAKSVTGKFLVGGKSFAVDVAPRDTQTVSVKLAKKIVPGRLQKIGLDWKFQSEGKTFDGSFRETAMAIPRFNGDWSKVPVMKMPCAARTMVHEKRGYPGDFEVSMQSAWTDDALCLRVAVTDDRLTAGSGPGCRWNYDVCQIFIDTRCSARQSKVNSFDDDDYQYDIMPTEDGKRCEVWRSLSPFVQYTLGTAAPKDGQLAPEIPAS